MQERRVVTASCLVVAPVAYRTNYIPHADFYERNVHSSVLRQINVAVQEAGMCTRKHFDDHRRNGGMISTTNWCRLSETLRSCLAGVNAVRNYAKGKNGGEQKVKRLTDPSVDRQGFEAFPCY